MACALNARIICFKAVQVGHVLIVSDEHHRVDRVLEVLAHQSLLDIRTAFVDKVEWDLGR